MLSGIPVCTWKRKRDLSMLRYEVTAEDIRDGCRYESSNCPHARAIDRELRPEYMIFLHRSEWLIVARERQYAILASGLTPEPIGAWLDHFDLFEKGEPGTFEIDIPGEYLR